MDVVNMAPPIKRRKLLSPAQHQTQHSAPFFHGVEHIESAAPPRRIDEVHLQIRRESVYNDGEQLRLRRRQGTAILPNILSTNSNADVVVAVTAKVDALGSTTALATAAVTVGLPDVPSLLSTSSTTSVISDDPVESSSSASPSSSAVPSTRDDPSPGSTTSSSSAPTSTSVLSSSSTTSSTTSNIESNARSSTESSVNSSTNESSTVASSTNESKINQSSTKESSTAASSTIASSTAESSSSSVSNGLRPDYTALSSSSSTTDNDSLSRSQSQTQSEYPESGTGSLVAPASTTGNRSSVTLASTSGTAPVQSSTSSSSSSDFESSTSSNSSMVVSTAQDSQSRTSQIVIPGTVSGFISQTGSALSSNSMNLTTSASTSSSSSTYISSGSTYVSVVAINIDSSTTRTGLKTADTTSSVDFGALFLATQSNGEVTTITRSSESFTTTLSDGQTATVSPSATSRTSSRAASSSASETSARGSVTTISSDRSTFISTVFSTDPTTSTKASPEYTPVSSDESDGTGLVGAAGDGATATSNGITSTSAASSNDSDDDAVAPAGTIAGGVVGGAAGLALVLAIVLLFMRRYKKRALLGHRALPANAAGAGAGSAGGSSSGGAGMAERAGLMGFAGAVPALFKHQKRSQNTVPETGERGFQRVAGRKLPSAYSEGMTGPTHKPMSPPPTMPLVSPEGHDGNLSSHSFYRDSDGFYGGDGSLSAPDPFSDNNIAAGAVGNEAAEHLIMSPGPQRRPTIHNRKSNVHSPSVATSGTPSWTPGSAAPFVRSETPVSLDGSRNSRFTEEV